MKTITLFWSAVFVITTGIAGGAGLPPNPDSPQVIQLDNGAKLTLLGTTYGTRHLAPNFENLAWSAIYTHSNTPVVWIQVEHQPSRWVDYELLVSDAANTACVAFEQSHPSLRVKDDVYVIGFVLNAFPRWDPETVLRVRPYREPVLPGQFVITNPPPDAAAAAWTPETLPSTKSDGDLEVTLSRLVAGAPAPHFQDQNPGPASDPLNQCVQLDFNFRQNGQPTTNWYPWLVQTSDATGNQVQGLIGGYPTNGIYPHHPPVGGLDEYFYRSGLWPDESAWKVRLEFVRQSNFDEGETITFTNLAVSPGSRQDFEDEWSRDEAKTHFNFVAQGQVNGIQLKLLPPLLLADEDQAGRKYISIIVYADPGPVAKTMHLTLLQATDEQGNEITTPFLNAGGWAGHFNLDFPNVGDIKTLTLKLALHKSRFVEFTVKPAKP